MKSVDLYRIVFGDTIYYLTSSATEQTHDGNTYEPAKALGRGGTQTKQELSKASLEVKLALEHELSQAMLSVWAETRTTLTVFQKRTLSTKTIWKGRLTAIHPEDVQLKMSFESIFTSMRRPGLRARFQKTCRHALYARGCFLDPADFAIAATVTTIAGTTFTVPAADGYDDGWFNGGMIASPDGTLSYISSHAGPVLHVNRLSSAMAAAYVAGGGSAAVTLYPGCPHDYVSCDTKFNNDLNYGGFDHIPTKNPMGGTSIV